MKNFLPVFDFNNCQKKNEKDEKEMTRIFIFNIFIRNTNITLDLKFLI